MDKEKVPINIVVIGHVDSGKSTLVDYLIDKLGGIDKSVIERFDKEAAEINKLSSKYAWVLGNLKAQRERGITNDIVLAMFETTKYYCTVIDATRHTEFFKNNMTHADCAVLVIDSTTSGLETGLSKDDKTCQQHAILASVFGVKQMIFCCNKMDATTPKYSRDRFEEIGKNFSSFFMRIGYNPCTMPFIPISGLEGDNLIEPSTNIVWYNGTTLLETLDLINKPTRPSMMIKDPGAVAFAVRDKYLSICRRLQCEARIMTEELKHFYSAGTKIMLDLSAGFLHSVMEECKCVSTEGRQDLLAKFQDAIMGELKHASSEGQNVMLDLSAKLLDSVKEKCKCVSTEGEKFRQDLLAQFQDDIKGLNCRLQELKDDLRSEIEGDDMFNKMIHDAEQYAAKERKAGFTKFVQESEEKRKDSASNKNWQW